MTKLYFPLSVCLLTLPVAVQSSAKPVSIKNNVVVAPIKADALRAGWNSPPEATKPHVYWYWLNNIVTKSGITRDLESMARSGIGGAYIGHIGGASLADVPSNSLVEPLSPESYELMQHAVREGLRTGVKIGVFNGPGWSQSGGPWVRPEDSMARIESAEVNVVGGRRFDELLPQVKGAIQDVRVIAFPTPLLDGKKISPFRVTSNQGEEFAVLANGEPYKMPANKSYAPLRLTYEFAEIETVRSIEFRHSSGAKVSGTVLISQDGKKFEPLRDFTLDRRNGPITQVQVRNVPSTVSIAPTKARFFRVEMPWDTVSNSTTLGITFSGAARVEMAEEKQLRVANKAITPPWDAFLWHFTPEPDAEATIAPERVIDLTDKMAADGRLNWEAPAGNWIVQRLSTVSTGAGNGPAPTGTSGLEIDKMSRAAAARHIELGTVGQLWKRLKPSERKGLHYAISDSYEKGPQNWTPGLEKEFQKRYGYDAIPYLPVLSGRVVGSASQSDRFLWDLRRLIADLIAVNYVGGLRDSVRPLGMNLWLENYGHYGFPAEFLSYGGQADGIGGEFWSNKPLSRMEIRGAASAAHIYGKTVVSAEAFTSAGNQLEKPGDIKTRSDFAFADGINHYVLHVTSHQPTEVPGPGLQLLWGTYFNRKSLWFAEHGSAWVDYVRRSSYLLQQGQSAADVAYFIGEDVPQMTGIQSPELPTGYESDFINAEALLTRAKVKDGKLVLVGGATYRVLALPPLRNMRPELLERIAQFVNQGLTVIGPAPIRSPSLQDYPRADPKVQALAAKLWPVDGSRSRKVGLGQVWRDASMQEVLSSLKVTPAIIESNPFILWEQRSRPDAEIFFLSNQTNQELQIAPSFRVTGSTPQLWNAETAQIETLAAYREAAGRTVVPLKLGPAQSIFVVFRRTRLQPLVVTEVKRDGKQVMAWNEAEAEKPVEIAESNLSHSFWVKPQGEIRLPEQKPDGNAMAGQRWVVLPPRGDKSNGPGFATRGDGYAVTGISVGRNGVVVVQRWAANAPAVLVWRAPKPLTDWTHVNIAYRAGVPHLYINGREVQSGLKTGQRVIAGDEGTTEGSDSGSPYETQVRGSKTSWKALNAVQIAALARDKGLIESTRIVRVDNSIQLQTKQGGRYQMRLTDGLTLSAQVSAPPPNKRINRAWNISFIGAAAPKPVRWNSLQSWSESKDEATKYFSGSAVYTTTFTMPANYDRNRTLGTLNLGRVESVARVALNGQLVGTALREPYELDVSRHLKPGVNTLRVLVTSNWANRMIGDEQFPDDLANLRAANGNLTKWPEWALNGTPRPEPRRITLSARRVYSKNSPLQPSGLIGPVTLEFKQNVTLKP